MLFFMTVMFIVKELLKSGSVMGTISCLPYTEKSQTLASIAIVYQG